MKPSRHGSRLVLFDDGVCGSRAWRGVADARADVWGLGATLYELLTLHRPFPTDSTATLASAIAERDPVLPTCSAPAFPATWRPFARKRWQSGRTIVMHRPEALVADLRRWLGGYETSARPWSFVARVVQGARRHKPWAVAAGAVVIGLLTASLLLWRREQIRADELKERGKAQLAEEKLLREADSSAKSKVWSLLELSRERAAVPRAGRRSDVAEFSCKQRSSAENSLVMRRAHSRCGFPLPLRRNAWHARYRGARGCRPLRLPNFEFRDWPLAIHPDGRQLALGTAKRPIIWQRGGAKARAKSR